MKKLAIIAALGTLGLAACGSADDASTEAMPDTVEMPAEEALEPIADEPVEDEEVGPPLDPADTAPDAPTKSTGLDTGFEGPAPATA